VTSAVTITGRDPATGAGLAVTLAEGLVTGIAPAENAGAAWLAPGLVDLQVNGYGGLDLNTGDVTPALVRDLCLLMAEVGVTTFLPTLITASEAAIVSALQALAAARAEFPIVGHMVPGVHVEGPSISPVDGPAAPIRSSTCARLRSPSSIAGRLPAATSSPW